MANSKEPYILLSEYQSLYREKYGKMPSINKYKEKWAMQDVIDSIGFDRAKQILNYYFSTSKVGHPLTFFYYNFDRMDVLQKELEKDKALRTVLRKQTKQLVEGVE